MAAKPKKNNLSQNDQPKTTMASAKRANYFDSLVAAFTQYEKHLVFGLAFLALIIRLYQIGFLSFWVDEYAHVSRVTTLFDDGKWAHIWEGEKNGLLVTFLNAFGFLIFGKNEFGGRVFIAFIGAGLVPVTYYFCKILFSRMVGLFAGILIVFSQYLVFWSRLDRQYGPAPTFYMLLILGVVLLLNKEPVAQSESGIWDKIGIDKKIFLMTVLVFILSFFTNFTSYFIIFSAGVYALYLYLFRGIKEKKWLSQGSPKILYFAFFSLFFFILSFTPINQVVMKPIFSKLMPESMVQLIIPDFKSISEKLTTNGTFYYFNVYKDVLLTDLPYSIYFFIAGLLALLVFDFKKFMILFSFYIIPFLMMGFIFLDPCLPRYHIFIYPLYLISVACSFYYWPKLLQIWLSNWFNGRYLNLIPFTIILFGIFFIFSKAIPNVIKLVTNETHGRAIDPSLSKWVFTNWKDPSNYIRKNIKPGDIVFSTVPSAINFYMSGLKNNIFLFRQMKLDPKTLQYGPMGNSPAIPSASSYDDLVKTLQANQRVWFITDYYLYNSLTDSRCRDIIFSNCNLIPEACKDGSVQLFLWEMNKSNRVPHNALWELGKPSGRFQSLEMGINISDKEIINGITYKFQSLGVDSNQEAYIILNRKDYFAIPKPSINDNLGKGESFCHIPGSKLVLGLNKVILHYNATKSEAYKGFIIFNMALN